MKPTIYIETSVISYLLARTSLNAIIAARQEFTRQWWKRVLPNLHPFISPTVLDEIGLGDTHAAEERLAHVASFPVLGLSPEIVELAKEYQAKSQIPEKSRSDAFHLAFASRHGMDYLVSWNMTHIVNARVRRTIEVINQARGIRTPTICTPEELEEV
ncbi:MAG: type II toxin-antitoxin system VapC family toxin [Ignavibacteriae bacterium]|nr:type II toxin-antitoxin system VapC family toxin [Ignavibacteriota bacterium]